MPAEPYSSGDDVARLFRENDSVGDASSIWYRATRYLFEKQRPILKTTCLTTGATTDGPMHLGLFTHTKKNRLIYWPALTKSTTIVFDNGTDTLCDHITLEVSNKTFHLTAYGESGEKVRVAPTQHMHCIPGFDLSLWFQALVKVEVLRNQDTAIQRLMHIPNDQQDRLIECLVKFRAELIFQSTNLPKHQEACDFVRYAVFVASDDLTIDQVPSRRDLLDNHALTAYVDGWETGEQFDLSWSSFSVGDCTLWIATACPPGTLRHPIAFHFPRRN